VVAKVTAVGTYLARVAFGTALLVSLATVALALSALSSSNQNDRDGRGRSYRGPSIWFNMTDFFWYFDPWYYRRREYVERSEEMGFLESIFSFVFGDGDPNIDFRARRWTALGQFIQSRGGVVTAEEIAPFLDATTEQMKKSISSEGIVIDESYVLPALTKFEGQPEVDGEGNIVYVFPSLQESASRGPIPVRYNDVLEEEWKLTRATSGQKVLVSILGGFNFVGVAALSLALRDPRNVYTLTINGLQGVTTLLPWLQLYALSFATIPLVRYFAIRQRNTGIRDRNEARMLASELLQNPSKELLQKLKSKQGKQTFK